MRRSRVRAVTRARERAFVEFWAAIFAAQNGVIDRNKLKQANAALRLIRHIQLHHDELVAYFTQMKAAPVPPKIE